MASDIELDPREPEQVKYFETEDDIHITEDAEADLFEGPNIPYSELGNCLLYGIRFKSPEDRSHAIAFINGVLTEGRAKEFESLGLYQLNAKLSDAPNVAFLSELYLGGLRFEGLTHRDTNEKQPSHERDGWVDVFNWRSLGTDRPTDFFPLFVPLDPILLKTAEGTWSVQRTFIKKTNADKY